MSSMKYDLRQVNDLPGIRSRFAVKWFGLGIACFFGAIFAYTFIILARGPDTTWVGYAVIALVMPLFFVILGFLLYLKAPRADLFVVVDEIGLSFTSSSRRVSALTWSEPNLSLELTTGAIVRGSVRSVVAVARFPSSKPHYLSLEAREAILEKARTLGLLISDRPSRFAGWTTVAISRA